MTDKLKQLIANLKHKPGVYLMYNSDSAIIYVGKAKDLQKRVSQYFLRPQFGKVAAMVSHVDHFETILTNNEKEAFVLEMNLIQTHYPRYNIMLKDDSHYPYIALKKKGDPYLVIKRKNDDNKFEYFGPFPHSQAAYKTIELANKIFPIRKCKNIQKESCLYFDMGQCLAPCVNNIKEEEFASIREDIKSFLRGNNSKVVSEIKEKMLKASDEMDYERAKEYKEILDAVSHINDSQVVELKDKASRDIFAYTTRNGYLSLALLLFRNGKLLGKNTFVVEEFLSNEEEVANLISQYYLTHPLPSEIIINNKEVVEALLPILECKINLVTKGKLHDQVLIALDNASNNLDQYFSSARLEEDKLAMLEELGKLIKIPTPLYIDLFDNSHLQGSDPVGAKVSFINGEKEKKLYRKFLITHEESRDDLASMKEVVYRHYKRSKEENHKLPDLLLVDGGLNQISSAKEIIDKLELKIPVFGLYKNDKHQTEGLMDHLGNTYKISNKNIFFLLTRMQDEVHRFAISFHASKRNKRVSISILDDIKGLGEVRKEMIKKIYKDINELRNASLEELSQLLPDETALVLYNKLHY